MPTGAHERGSKGETLARERKVFFFEPYISKFVYFPTFGGYRIIKIAHFYLFFFFHFYLEKRDKCVYGVVNTWFLFCGGQ